MTDPPPPPATGIANPTLIRVLDEIDRALDALQPPPAANTSNRSRNSRRRRPRPKSTKEQVDSCVFSQSDAQRDDAVTSSSMDNGVLHLSSLDPDVLRTHLAPALQQLEQLDAEGVLGLERTTELWMGPARLNDDVSVIPIHEVIEPRERRRHVRYLHLTEERERYSVGIFVFPPGATIPLHDHPGMAVLSRLLYGEITARSFDLVPKPYRHNRDHRSEAEGNGDVRRSKYDKQQPQPHSPPPQSQIKSAHRNAPSLSRSSGSFNSSFHSSLTRTASWLSSFLRRSSSALSTTSVTSTTSHGTIPEGSLRAQTKPVKRLRAPATTMLLPHQGNVHEFTAGPDGAAILDVLLPPYDNDQDRECTFYRVLKDAAPSADNSSSIGNDNGESPVPMDEDTDDGTTRKGKKSSKKLRGNCWLIPIDQPSDFQCISGQYGEVGVAGGSA